MKRKTPQGSLKDLISKTNRLVTLLSVANVCYKRGMTTEFLETFTGFEAENPVV